MSPVVISHHQRWAPQMCASSLLSPLSFSFSLSPFLSLSPSFSRSFFLSLSLSISLFLSLWGLCSFFLSLSCIALSLSHTHTHTHTYTNTYTHTNHGAGGFSAVPGGFGATACAAVFGCSLEAIPAAAGAFDQPAPWCSGAPTAGSFSEPAAIFSTFDGRSVCKLLDKLTNKSSGPLFTAAARVAAPATKCSQPATCNVFGCSRKTWNSKPSEQCCRTCKSSGGTHHGPDCESIVHT